MKGHPLNQSQRIVIIVGLAFALYVLGEWLNGLGSTLNYGWVAFAPLGNQINNVGLHPWVRLVIWIVLVALWVAVSLRLLRSKALS